MLSSTFKYHEGMSDNKLVISDEAVEAAANASYESVRPRMGFPTGFDDAPEPLQGTYRDIARAALEAAAPHMLADAWEAGADAYYSQLSKVSFGFEFVANPYRSQA